MKKFIAVITIFFALTMEVCAQEAAKHRLQLQAGLSWVGVFANVANRLNVVEDIDVTVSPSLHLAYDYFYSDRISLGAAFAYQQIGVSYQNYTFEEDGQAVTDNYSTDARRIHISARALYWYNPQSNFRLYSGVRLGVSNWTADTTVPDPTYDPDRFINLALGANFSPQLVVLGTDLALGSGWNISGELAIGAPYFASAGVAYRW